MREGGGQEGRRGQHLTTSFYPPPPLQLCASEGGACVTTLDGYYVESVVCVLIGLTWWVWLGKKMRRLQEESPASWRCPANRG